METTAASITHEKRNSRLASREDRLPPRIWGKSVPEIWSLYLAERRVQCVVAGRSEDLRPGFTYLLCDPRHVIDFDVAKGLDLFRKCGKDFAWVRLRGDRPASYRERHVVDPVSRRLRRIERQYNSPRARRYRLAMTRSVELATQWQNSRSVEHPLADSLDRQTASRRGVIRVEGAPFDLEIEEDVTRFMVRLIRNWKNPAGSLPGLTSVRPGVWGFDSGAVPAAARVVGQIWVGNDRFLEDSECLVGPAVLWDRSLEERSRRSRLTEAGGAPANPLKVVHSASKRSPQPVYEFCKRLFDITFACVALALTLPFYPIIALLIYLEDGRPIFFGHARETKGGGSFDCMKFRSMRRDAEEVRRRILEQNMCDGPQFFIDRDPRLTRVGRILRDLQVDEWPQFFHVLTGKMSVVGPRPLPKPENQYCPAWRETRLSVRPGITGLWQIKRKRLPGLDFQEWIRYDIEYVENRSMAMDLSIIFHSVWMLVRLGWSVLTGNHTKRPAHARADQQSVA
jgi:lipopolysaccharide/colanic/teichoic acid biosynthesis glycosyltransferase